MGNRILEKMSRGEVALGVWINSSDPLIADIAVTYGAEWLLIDLEHEPIGRQNLVGLLMACRGSECQPFVRIPENRDAFFKWVLDLGAAGVIVPQIRSIADAEAAVRFAKYRPLGRRGVSPMRASRYYADGSYMQRANQDIALVLQVEDAALIEEIETLVALEGVDALFIGPRDLSDSLGISGQLTHRDFLQAIDKITGVCRKHGMPLFMPAADPEARKRYFDKGVRGFTVTSDYQCIIRGIESSLGEAKKAFA
jgi:2-keto-3-deoxy-L-rhamnonate aldolase RhmA